MKKKTKILFNTLFGATLILPFATYLLLMATILNIKYDHQVVGEVEIVENVIYSNDKETIFNGRVEWLDEFDTYGIVMEEDEIAKVGRKFYSYELNDKKEYELVELNAWGVQKKESWKLPVSLIISAFGIVIVALVFVGKLKVRRKYLNVSILISLVAGWGFSYVIGLIAGGVANVFLVAAISWGLFMAELKVYEHLNKEEREQKAASELATKLDKLIDML